MSSVIAYTSFAGIGLKEIPPSLNSVSLEAPLALSNTVKDSLSVKPNCIAAACTACEAVNPGCVFPNNFSEVLLINLLSCEITAPFGKV